MSKILHVNFSVPAICGVGFEIEAHLWNDLSDENKEMVMLHYAYKADSLLYNGELDDLGDGIGCNAHIADVKSIDFDTIEIDDYDYDNAAHEEGTRYERAFGDGSDL